MTNLLWSYFSGALSLVAIVTIVVLLVEYSKAKTHRIKALEQVRLRDIQILSEWLTEWQAKLLQAKSLDDTEYAEFMIKAIKGKLKNAQDIKGCR